MNSEPLYDPDTIQLETSLGYYLAKARNVLVMRTDQALKPLDLTSPQIGVIMMLASGRRARRWSCRARCPTTAAR